MSKEAVNHPEHYQHGSIETIQVIEEMGIGPEFCLGNAIKYLMRAKQKGGVQDLQKAAWYLHRMIGQVDRDALLVIIQNLLVDHFPEAPTAEIAAQLFKWGKPRETED